MDLNRRALLPAAGLLLTAGAASAQPLRDAALSAAIDARVRRQMELAHIPGVAVAVLQGGRPVLVRGYGAANLEWDLAVGGDTAFQLASATKIFTGIALMRLVEKGRIELDAPVSRYLTNAPAGWRDVTVRRLATHSSGVPDDLGASPPPTVDGLVAAAMQRPLAYAPGSQSRYGFIDFVVLRAALEQVAGKPIEALVRDEIVSPLGLTHTGFAHARNDGPIRSSGLVRQRASIYAWSDGAQRVSDFLYDENGYGAGGLYASANDLARVFAALEDASYLSPASVAALQSAPALNDGRPGEFGVGWTVRRYHGLRVVGHSGGPALSDLLHAPQSKLTVIALTNQQRYYPLLAESIADLFLGDGPAPRILPDDRPELTARMVRVLGEAAAGRLDQTAFTEAGRQGSGGFLDGFGRVLLECVGPVRRADLLKSQPSPDGLQRSYRVVFAERPMTWRFTTTSSGAIAALHPVGEDG